MTAPGRASQKDTLIDLGYSSLRILAGQRGAVLPLERVAGGTLEGTTLETVESGLRSFLGIRGRSTRGTGEARLPRRRRRAVCALSARGVSLRCFDIPNTADEELAAVIALQVEAGFPLPPEELAWSYLAEDSRLSGAQTRRVAVAAMRRSLLEEYAELLRHSGLEPSFRLGALAVSRLCPSDSGKWAVLDVGGSHSQLLLLEGTLPTSLSSFSWGGDRLTERAGVAAGLSLEHAEKVKREQQLAGVLSEEGAQRLLSESAEELADRLAGCWGACEDQVPRRLFLTGGGARLRDFERALEEALGPGITCQRPPIAPGQAFTPGHSSVTLGLLEEVRQSDSSTTFVFDPPEPRFVVEQKTSEANVRPWLIALVALLLVAFVLPNIEALWKVPQQRDELEHARSLRSAMPSLDADLAFFDFLDEHQTPYLDCLAVIAARFPKGTTVEGITLSAAGNIIIEGKTKSAQSVNEFRSALIGSGWFRPVVIESQTQIKKLLSFRLRASLRNDRSPLPEPDDSGRGTEGQAPGEANPSKPPESPPESKGTPPRVASEPSTLLPNAPSASGAQSGDESRSGTPSGSSGVARAQIHRNPPADPVPAPVDAPASPSSPAAASAQE